MGKLHGHNEGETERLNRGGDRRKREGGWKQKKVIGTSELNMEGEKGRSAGQMVSV